MIKAGRWGIANLDMGHDGEISLWVHHVFDATVADHQSVSTPGTRWLWTKHVGLRLGPDAAWASRTGAMRRCAAPGESINGPSGEPVSRCLTLKGSFKGGVQLDQNIERCRACDAANQHLMRRWLSQRDWDGVLVGNIDLLGLEILQPLIDAAIPLLHHIGFVTPPFDPTLTPKTTRYLVVCASQAVKQNLIQAGMGISTAPVVYPGARVELYGSRIDGRPLPAPPSPSQQHPLKICFAGLQMSSKGPHTLLEAIALLKNKNIPTYCMLAGGVFQESYMHAMQRFIDTQKTFKTTFNLSLN